MELLQKQLSEATNLQLANSRYSFDYMESMEDALRRAQGLAGMLVDSAIMAQNPQVNHEIHPLHLEQTAKAIEQEVRDALILINCLYHQCSPNNCTLGTNLATREFIKHCKDVPVIIAF